MIEDVNTFADLATRRTSVAILDHTTRGAPERSARYRDLLLRADIPHELRAAFVIRGRVWGAVHIARRGASGPFEQRDADALAASPRWRSKRPSPHAGASTARDGRTPALRSSCRAGAGVSRP